MQSDSLDRQIFVVPTRVHETFERLGTLGECAAVL
jgi:hypothetical protein